MTANQTLNRTIIHSSKEPRIQSPQRFSKQEVNFSQTPLFFPEGFEKIFLALYFVTLPYLAGLLFLFFYVAEGKPELFSSLNKDSSFMLTWVIGYEIIAVIILLWIVKMALGFTDENPKPATKEFHRL